MIFVFLGIIILIISFVVAFISLLREQKTGHQLGEVFEPELNDDEAILTVQPKRAGHKKQIIVHEEPITEVNRNKFPWEENEERFPQVSEKTQNLEKVEDAQHYKGRLGG